MEERSKFYKKPLKFGAQTLYESDIIDKISDKHWETFHNKSQSGEKFMIGDYIDLAVRLTAQQLVDFLDEIRKMETIEEIHAYIDALILELAKEIKLD